MDTSERIAGGAFSSFWFVFSVCAQLFRGHLFELFITVSAVLAAEGG